MQLDHVNDDGNVHRLQSTFSYKAIVKGIKRIGVAQLIYKWAADHNFPSTLQLLCANCHSAKSFYGGCDPGSHEITEGATRFVHRVNVQLPKAIP